MIQTDVRFPSHHLGMRVSMNVLLPKTGDGPFSTLYLLHGLSDDHTMWHRLTQLEVFASRLPMAIVMPQGFRGFYTRNEAGPDYASYIADDFLIDQNRALHAEFKARGIAHAYEEHEGGTQLGPTGTSDFQVRLRITRR